VIVDYVKIPMMKVEQKLEEVVTTIWLVVNR